MTQGGSRPHSGPESHAQRNVRRQNEERQIKSSSDCHLPPVATIILSEETVGETV